MLRYTGDRIQDKTQGTIGSFDLLSLQLDRLVVHEDTLALVRLRLPPFSNLGRKLRDDLLVDALEQNARRLGRAGLDALRDSQLDRVGVSDLQINKLLARVLGFNGGCGRLDRSPVTDTVQTEDADVAFGNTQDVVLQMCSHRSCSPTLSERERESYIFGRKKTQAALRTPHGALVRFFSILYGDGRFS